MAGIERLIALGWTEEAIAIALARRIKQIRKLRMLANVLPAMLDHGQGQHAAGAAASHDPAASFDEHKEEEAYKMGEAASWWAIATGLPKTRMFALRSSFGDGPRQAYGIGWAEDLFPAD